MLEPEFSKRYGMEVPKYKLKGAVGIKIIGDSNFGELDVKNIEKILNEVVIVTGGLDLQNVPIKSLGKLESVGGYLNLENCKNLTSLGKLKYVGGYLDLKDTEIKSLGELEYVGEYLTLTHTPIEDLGNLTSVGSLNLSNTQIESLGKLEFVGYNLYLSSTQIKSLGNLTYVGYNLYLRNTPLGKELKDSGMSIEEIKNKFGVKDELYI
jgi:Leucine-rich repeat (LRR) protein